MVRFKLNKIENLNMFGGGRAYMVKSNKFEDTRGEESLCGDGGGGGGAGSMLSWVMITWEPTVTDRHTDTTESIILRSQ